MSYPDYTSCLKLLTDAGVSAGVLKHVKAVHRFAVTITDRVISRGYEVNMPLLEAGALLHDIGRSKIHDLSHAVVGGEIAETLGLPPDLVLIIENHIGAGITREEAINIGLPARDFIPRSVEEKIVAAADNLAFGDNLQTIRQHEQNMVSKGVIEGAKRCVALHIELSQMCGIDLDDLLSDYLAHNNLKNFPEL